MISSKGLTWRDEKKVKSDCNKNLNVGTHKDPQSSLARRTAQHGGAKHYCPVALTCEKRKGKKTQRNQRKELGLGLTVTMNQLLLSAWNILVALRMWDDHADAIALGVVRAQM